MSLPAISKKKNKVFVSQAMQHSTPEKVHKERDAIMEKLKKVYPEHEFELIDQYHVDEPVEWKSKSPRELRWARLGRSIEMMSHADIIVFAESALMKNYAPGCMAEHTVAMSYKSEYDPDEYVVIQEATLDRYIQENKLCAFYDNIIKCVSYDVKIFVDYFEELITIVKRFIPIDNMNFTVNDTENEWYTEWVQYPYYICAELSKCCIIDEEDYDNGKFFTFTMEMGNPTDKSIIIIKSYNNGDVKGLKLDKYDLSNNTTHIALFEALKEVCERETRANKPNII